MNCFPIDNLAVFNFRSSSNISSVAHCDHGSAYRLLGCIPATAADNNPTTGSDSEWYHHAVTGSSTDPHPHTSSPYPYPARAGPDHSDSAGHPGAAGQTVPSQSGSDPRGPVSDHWATAAEIPVSTHTAKVSVPPLLPYISFITVYRNIFPPCFIPTFLHHSENHPYLIFVYTWLYS